jgi:putative ABC transport system substrate-binding protein
MGESLIIDERWANGDASIMPRLARELSAERPDILVSTGTTETRAHHELTKTIPIVFMQLAVDPVAVGLVQRISRPGGNVTGFMQWPQLLWGKRLELLTELQRRPRRPAAGGAGQPVRAGDQRAGRAGHRPDGAGAAARAGGRADRVS